MDASSETVVDLYGAPDPRGISGPYGMAVRAGDQDNRIKVLAPDGGYRYLVRDRGAGARPLPDQPRCERESASAVRCQAYGGSDIRVRGSGGDDRLGLLGNVPYYSARLDGGPGDDRLEVVRAGRPNHDQTRFLGGAGADSISMHDESSIAGGGGGADRIRGSRWADRIGGGGGPDVITGKGGGDKIGVADERPNDHVECGGGRDRVLADRGDEIGPGCEKVRFGSP